jgi:hypothetical protein
MDRRVFCALSLLLLVAAISAAGLPCLAGTPSSGDVVLRIKDAQQRPVANATVSVEYSVTEPLYGESRKTEYFKSDEAGVFERVMEMDLGSAYRFNVSIHNSRQVVEGVWGGGFDRYVNLDALDFTIRVVDSQGMPLANIPLTVNGSDGFVAESSTNATGYRFFPKYNSDTTYNILAHYGQRERYVWIRADSQIHTIVVPTFTLEVRVFSDNSSTLFSSMQANYTGVGPVSRDSEGIVGSFSQIPEGNVSLRISHQNRTLYDTVYLNSSILKVYVFDLTPPQISEPSLEPARPIPENPVRVTVTVTDPGRNASGLPPPVNSIPPVELYYSLDGLSWGSAHMFPQGDSGTYVGTIPGQPVGSIVRYFVKATDAEGNVGATRQYVFNTFLPETPTPAGTPGSGLEAQAAMLVQLAWENKLAVAVGLVIIAGVMLVIRSRAPPPEDEGREEEPW